MVCYDRTIFENLRVQKNLNLRKSPLKLFKLSSKQCILLSFYIFTVRILHGALSQYPNDSWHKR